MESVVLPPGLRIECEEGFVFLLHGRKRVLVFPEHIAFRIVGENGEAAIQLTAEEYFYTLQAQFRPLP